MCGYLLSGYFEFRIAQGYSWVSPAGNLGWNFEIIARRMSKASAKRSRTTETCFFRGSGFGGGHEIDFRFKFPRILFSFARPVLSLVEVGLATA